MSSTHTPPMETTMVASNSFDTVRRKLMEMLKSPGAKTVISTCEKNFLQNPIGEDCFIYMSLVIKKILGDVSIDVNDYVRSTLEAILLLFDKNGSLGLPSLHAMTFSAIGIEVLFNGVDQNTKTGGNIYELTVHKPAPVVDMFLAQSMQDLPHGETRETFHQGLNTPILNRASNSSSGVDRKGGDDGLDATVGSKNFEIKEGEEGTRTSTGSRSPSSTHTHSTSVNTTSTSASIEFSPVRRAKPDKKVQIQLRKARERKNVLLKLGKGKKNDPDPAPKGGSPSILGCGSDLAMAVQAKLRRMIKYIILSTRENQDEKIAGLFEYIVEVQARGFEVKWSCNSHRSLEKGTLVKFLFDGKTDEKTLKFMGMKDADLMDSGDPVEVNIDSYLLIQENIDTLVSSSVQFVERYGLLELLFVGDKLKKMKNYLKTMFTSTAEVSTLRERMEIMHDKTIRNYPHIRKIMELKPMPTASVMVKMSRKCYQSLSLLDAYDSLMADEEKIFKQLKNDLGVNVIEEIILMGVSQQDSFGMMAKVTNNEVGMVIGLNEESDFGFQIIPPGHERYNEFMELNLITHYLNLDSEQKVFVLEALSFWASLHDHENIDEFLHDWQRCKYGALLKYGQRPSSIHLSSCIHNLQGVGRAQALASEDIVDPGVGPEIISRNKFDSIIDEANSKDAAIDVKSTKMKLTQDLNFSVNYM